MNWTDTLANERGNPTTVRRWLNLSGSTVQNHPSGSYIETHAQYDQCGSLRFATDARGKVSETIYTDAFSDSVNRNTFAYPTQVKTPVPDPTNVYGTNAQLTSSTVYEFKSGKTTSTTDANGQTTSFSYLESANVDALIRLRKVTLPASQGETLYNFGDYPGDIYISTATKQDASTWLEDYTYFDGIGRAIRAGHKESASQWSVKDTEYDSLGRVHRVTNPYFAANLSSATPGNAEWTTTTYDTLNRALTVTTPDGAVTTTGYDLNKVTVTDPANKNRSSVTDALGRLTQVIEAPNAPNALNYQNNYTHDALGNLTTVEQGGQYRYFFYDSLSRLVRAKNPEQDAHASLALTNPPAYNNNWSLGYTFDANGNIETRTDSRPVTTTYTYDNLNRNTITDYGDATPDVKRFYDKVTLGKGRFHFNYSGGDISTGTTVEHTAIDSYDAVGRPLTGRQLFKTSSVWGQTFNSSRAYDLAGHITSQTYPSGRTVSYSYNAGGRLASASGNLGGTTYTYADTLSYTAAGQMAKERFGTATPLYHNLHYNNRLQLVDLRLGDNASEVAPYQVGTYSVLRGLSEPHDGLVIHHVPQGHAAAQVIPGYEYANGPAIALPRAEHLQIPNLRGQYPGTAQELIQRDINNLRTRTKTPESAIKQLSRLIRGLF